MMRKNQLKLKKNLIKLYSCIFIYILCIGCNNTLICESDCYLELDVPLAHNNGFYHIELLSNYTQTFATIEANTGSVGYNEKVAWMSNKEVYIQGEWTNIVNKNSYTDEMGVAKTVISIWNEFVGDTIIVYSGYIDQCEIHHTDSLKIIVN